MRAIAVLGVVLYHAGFGPPAGFVGVDVFFVISGFLITSLLKIELSAEGRIDLAAFYSRRARRLLPALALVLAFTVLVSFFILSPYDELASALTSLAAAAVFGANLLFQYTTGDYFGPDVNKLPALHLWSLGVEEQYYLLWPIALLFSHRLPINGRRALFAFCVIASLAFAESALYRGSQAAFYGMPSRWWELSLGALVAWAPEPQKRFGRWESWAGMLLLFISMVVPTQHFPGVGALPATLGAAMLLHASTLRDGPWKFISSRVLLMIGRVSYPFYLWHWPLLAFAAVEFPGELPALVRAALVLCAFLLAVATWRWVESPLRSIPILHPRKFAAATLLTCVAIALILVQVADATRAYAVHNDPEEADKLDMPANIMRCHNTYDSPAKLPDETECTLGGQGSPEIVIWGDSHALALQGFATAIALREGKIAIAYSRDACPPAVDYDNGQKPLQASRCQDFNKVAIARAEKMDTVILAARWPKPDNRDFAADFTTTVDQLASHVRHIFIIGPTPVLPADAPSCLKRNRSKSCDLARSDFIARSAAIRSLLSALPTSHANVTYVEPIDFFCNARVCPGIRDGMVLYWDTHHITSTAAAAFGKAYLTDKPDRDL